MRNRLLGVFLVLLLQSLCAVTAGRPNILLVVADDWSHPHAGVYGCKWVRTPSFDRLASNGIVFDRAYTPNAKCAPSRACILTGRNSWQLKEAGNHWAFFPQEYRSFPEALLAQGYHTGFTGKGWQPGIAQNAKGQPRLLLGEEYSKLRLTPPTAQISSIDYAANFAAFLASVPESTPWCFWVGSNEPHRAYEYGSAVQKGARNTKEIDRVPAYWPDCSEVRNDMLDYAFELEHFDSHLGRIIAELERRNELSNTLIIVTADNGLPFPRAKGQAYEISNHLPLVIHWPALQGIGGRRISDYVSFVDLAPTILEAAHINWDASGLAATPGRSLLPLISTSQSGLVDPTRNYVLIGKERHDIGRPGDQGYPIRGIVSEDWLYLHNFETSRWPAGNPETGYLNCDGGATKSKILSLRRDQQDTKLWRLCFAARPTEELYDLRNDADCVRNLATSPSQQERVVRMRTLLFERLTAQEDPRMLGRGSVFDTYQLADPKYRGFYEKFSLGLAPFPTWVNSDDFENEKLPLD